MPSITVEVEFRNHRYTASVGENDVYLVGNFDNAAAVILAYYINERPPQDFLVGVDIAPDKLSEFAAWRVLEVEDMPSILVGEGSTQRLDDLETAFNVENDGDINFDVWCAWCDSDDRIYTKNDYYNRYCGTFNNEGGYAEELLDDCLGLHDRGYDMVRCYIDYEGMERDMALNGDIVIIEHGGQRHIFRKW